MLAGEPQSRLVLSADEIGNNGQFRKAFTFTVFTILPFCDIFMWQLQYSEGSGKTIVKVNTRLSECDKFKVANARLKFTQEYVRSIFTVLYNFAPSTLTLYHPNPEPLTQCW